MRCLHGRPVYSNPTPNPWFGSRSVISVVEVYHFRPEVSRTIFRGCSPDSNQSNLQIYFSSVNSHWTLIPDLRDPGLLSPQSLFSTTLTWTTMTVEKEVVLK